MYTMLCGRPPFETPDINKTYKRIAANDWIWPEKNNLSEQAKDIITKILVLKPQQRPKVDEILDHDFF